MSRDLLDAVNGRNPRALIGDTDPSRRHLGPDRAIRVLVLLADHANAVGEVWWSAGAIADELHLDRRDVRHALGLWERRGLLARTGARRELGGSVVYRFTDPDTWPADYAPRRHAEQGALTLLTVARPTEVGGGIPRSEVGGEVGGKLGGEVGGEVGGHPRHEGKGSEAKGGSPRKRTSPRAEVGGEPRPCPKHPNGWHHEEPCGRCASLREWDEAKPRPRPAPAPEAEPWEGLDPEEVARHAAEARALLALTKPAPRTKAEPRRIQEAETPPAPEVATSKNEAATPPALDEDEDPLADTLAREALDALIAKTRARARSAAKAM